jgi:hypothetical protein
VRRTLALLLLFAAVPVGASAPAVTVSPARLLEWAGEMEVAGRTDLARRALAALTADQALPIRQEARFRIARLDAAAGRHADAALLYRTMLDEEPGAQRVRLELAAVLAAMGDEAGARKALREAQAAGLPPEVAQVADRFSAALRSRKRLGATVEVALAPDTNIARAPRGDRLETVLGDFELDADARARSGLGFAASGQIYARHPIGRRANLLARLSGAASLYRQSRFNDVALGLVAGPELALGADRLALEAGVAQRWFGGERWTTTTSIGANWFHPLDRRSQLRLASAIGFIANHRNDWQDGRSYSLSASYERATSARAGLGVALALDRQALREPSLSTTAGQATLLGYRDFGAATLVGTLTVGRLRADERQYLFPQARAETLTRATLAATFRQLRVGSLAPLLRLTAERNASNIAIYDYRRLRTEIGVTRAF